MNSGESTRDSQSTISLADEEAVRQILSHTVFGLWDIVNNLSRLCVNTADEAIALLRERHARWKSDQTV